MVTEPWVERFWAKVDKSGDCWLWTGAVNDSGYGVILGDEKRLVYAHRIAYEKLVGPVPDGLTLDHLCHTKICVNPAHLEPVSAVENTHRGRRRPDYLSARASSDSRKHALVGWRPIVSCLRPHIAAKQKGSRVNAVLAGTDTLEEWRA